MDLRVVAAGSFVDVCSFARFCCAGVRKLLGRAEHSADLLICRWLHGNQCCSANCDRRFRCEKTADGAVPLGRKHPNNTIAGSIAIAAQVHRHHSPQQLLRGFSNRLADSKRELLHVQTSA